MDIRSLSIGWVKLSLRYPTNNCTDFLHVGQHGVNMTVFRLVFSVRRSVNVECAGKQDNEASRIRPQSVDRQQQLRNRERESRVMMMIQWTGHFTVCVDRGVVVLAACLAGHGYIIL